MALVVADGVDVDPCELRESADRHRFHAKFLFVRGRPYTLEYGPESTVDGGEAGIPNDQSAAGTPRDLKRVFGYGPIRRNNPMSDDAKVLRTAAIAAHTRGDHELAAEVFRRVLMNHPGTPEARDAVVYLTEDRRLPPDVTRARAERRT
jgi:hypothetical protein